MLKLDSGHIPLDQQMESSFITDSHSHISLHVVVYIQKHYATSARYFQSLDNRFAEFMKRLSFY